MSIRVCHDPMLESLPQFKGPHQRFDGTFWHGPVVDPLTTNSEQVRKLQLKHVREGEFSLFNSTTRKQ